MILATAKCLYYFHLYCVSVQRRGEIWYYRNAVLQLKTKVQFNISYIYPILPHICGKWFISVNNDQNIEKILLLIVIVVVDSIVIILLMKIFFHFNYCIHSRPAQWYKKVFFYDILLFKTKMFLKHGKYFRNRIFIDIFCNNGFLDLLFN